jgi:polar amino acid transport system permease protein
MASNSLTSGSADPQLAQGYELLAIQRRQWLITQVQIAIVWMVLVALIAGVLLRLRFEPAYSLAHVGVVWQGLQTTIILSLLSIAFASVLALLGALGRLSSNPVAQGASGLYVSLIRGTPLLIQLFLIYNGLPQIGQQLSAIGLKQIGNALILSGFWSGVLALSLNYGAYMTEIFRAGMQSIGYGQREAALAIGMTRWQTLRRVIMPQAVRIIIPDIGNQFIAMQKDSSLVSVMGVWEITYRASRFARVDSKFMEMFLLAAAMYWILTIISTWMEERLERRLAHAYER